MCVIEQTVEDGVAEGGITDDIVPVLDGDLARRATSRADREMVDRATATERLAGVLSSMPVDMHRLIRQIWRQLPTRTMATIRGRRSPALTADISFPHHQNRPT